jgi:HSP20 family protein
MTLTRFFPEASFFATQTPPQLRSVRTRAISRTIPIDLQETDTAYIIKADVPGFKKEQIKLNAEGSINGSNVYISAKKHVTKEEDGPPYFLRERMHQNVRRTVSFPMDIQADQIEAKCEDGVLHLNVPKGPKAQAKKITVR